MSRRSVFAAITAIALAFPAAAQYSTCVSNSFEVDNGIESLYVWNPITTRTTGNVAGSGVVNTTPNDGMFWVLLPKEEMNAGNCTGPPTMELVSNQAHLNHSFWGDSGAAGTPAVIWDQTINYVQYTNPTTAAGPDGRRYPNLSVAPLITILGGPSGFPPPTPGPCPPNSPIKPNLDGYLVEFDYATAVSGSGFAVPADGVTELAWCFWQPGGMIVPAVSPDPCELGGNLSLMSGLSDPSGDAEHVPAGLFNVAGTDYNPFSGLRGPTGSIDNLPNRQSFSNWPGFRDPILEPNSAFFRGAPVGLRERGAGAWFLDGTAPGTTMRPGFRTQATGHLGELVIHVLSVAPTPLLPHPGITLGTPGCLLVDWAPTNVYFFLLTPTFDTFVGFLSNGVSEFVSDKDVADTPTPISFIGPVVPPGFTYDVQAFILDVSVSPVTVVGTNVIQCQLY